MNRIITISRQFGSGGRTIGREVAKKLKIPCYDQELIEKVQTESGFTKEFIQEHGEEATSGLFGSAFGRDLIWGAQYKIINRIAEEGPCVIVGRCADYILQERASLLKVFIHADVKKRAERIVKLYGERPVSPEKRLKEKDKRRAAYYRYYTDWEWGDAKNYDISLDSGTLGIEKCVKIITDLF